MKKYIAIIFLLASSYFYAQNDEPKNPFIPNIVPPSPEAFALTKYGDLSMDEFNGKVNLDIPIYEYKVGQLKLPISLNYHGAGVRIKQTPTQVGINFTLNAGGVIAREIRDISDESSNRIVLTQQELMNLNGPDCSSEAITLGSYIDNVNIDSESDIFNFNFMGFAGSFYLDKDFIPRLTKNDSELKIQILGSLYSDKIFLITDPTGIKYYFGGNVIEYSTIDNIVDGRHDMNAAGGVTSFYLYKIEHPTNGVINLEYETKPNYSYVLNSNFTKTVNYENGLDSHCNIESLRAKYSQILSKIYIGEPKLLTKISSPNSLEEIIFQRVDFNQSIISTLLKTALTSITIKNNNVITNDISLNYTGLDDLNNIKRFFLSKIEFNSNTSSQKNQVYKFEYNDPNGLPSANSYKIDVLGYFNNKNNSDLNPCFPEDNATLCPNRSPDFEYASKGVLKRVVYPTKGYTEFEYEPQPYVEKKYSTYSAITYINSTGTLDEQGVFVNGMYQKLHDEFPKSGIDELGSYYSYLYEPIEFSQTVPITLTATTTNNLHSLAYTHLKITEMLEGNILSIIEKQTSSIMVFDYDFKRGHNYKIEINLTPPFATSQGYSAGGNFSFTLHTDYHAPTSYGIRLKKQKDYESVASNPIIKRYYYKPFHKLNNIFADQFYLGDNTKRGAWVMKCTSGGGSAYDGSVFSDGFGFASTFNIINTKTKSSDYNFGDFGFNSLHFDYATICVSYGGDNFEKGGVEKTYGVEESDIPLKLNSVSTNSILSMDTNNHLLTESGRKGINKNPLDGTLLKEKVFTKIGNSIFKSKETIYEYNSTSTFGLLNFFGSKIFNEFPPSPIVCEGNYHGKTLSNYNIFTYFDRVFDFRKTAEKSTTYIDPIPTTLIAHEPTGQDDPTIEYPTQDQLEAPYKKVITIQTYEYGALKGLPTKVTTTVSGGGTKSTENVYVNQFGSLSGLTANQSTAYTALLNQNNVASPIETHQLENGTLLSKQRTTYQTLAGNKIVPEIIQTAKGTANLEDRAVFEEYDSKGNPTLMALTGGSKIKYVYNNLNQVIAKIENFTGTLDPNTNSIADACSFINEYPNSQVSVFKYDAITNLLVEKFDANCQKTTYIYDALYRLKQIKDNDNNVIQEFDNNYRPN